MAQAPSIPKAHHTKVIRWWLTGKSPREISDRLRDEHAVVTSHTSVLRLVDHVADGHADESLLAALTRLRLRSTALVDQVEENLTLLRVEAGLEAASEETPRRGALNLRLFDLTDRITIRHLRLAGLGSRTGERLVEKFAAQQRKLADERCATLGVVWPFEAPEQEPSKEAATEATAATRAPSPVAATPRESRAPVTSTAEPVQPATRAASTPDSVRMMATPSALVAEIDASAPDTPTPPPLEIPTNIAPRQPCPCGSGLRFRNCHGKAARVHAA